MKRLMNSSCLDEQGVCRALHSGISFCYSDAYQFESNQKSERSRVHLINRYDFPSKCDQVLDEMITSVVGIMNMPEIVKWVRVSHNFCVQSVVENKNFKFEIECHTMDTGIVLFRRMGAKWTSDRALIAFVYIPPEIVKNIPDIVKESSKILVSDESNSHPIPPHPLPVVHHEEHSLVQIVNQLVTQHLGNKRDLLRNATDTLFILNAICIHNKDFFEAGGSAEKHHKLLRCVWFDTYTHHAAKMCNGVQNEQFWAISLHLFNLSMLPLNCVGYWATVPYV
jgi:hypothetical protein